MYGHNDPAFQVAYRSTADNQMHVITVRARNLDTARQEFQMRAAPGATVLAVRGAWTRPAPQGEPLGVTEMRRQAEGAGKTLGETLVELHKTAEARHEEKQ